MQQNRRSGGTGWLGWVIFIVLIFGSRFLPPLANWLSQQTGIPISPGALVATIIGLSVALTIVSSVIGEINRNRPQGDTRLPTGQPPAGRAPVVPPPQPPPQPPTTLRTPSLPRPSRLPSGEQRLPPPPRFEPIIDPRVLTFGIIGLVVFGGFFLAVLLLSGALP